MFKPFLATLILLSLSTPALALVTVCSGEYLPGADVTTVRHEALWNYHDNWIFDLHVEVVTQVEGEVSAAGVETFPMGHGGHAVSWLPQPPTGDYRIQGSLRLGYPLVLGFDGYQQLDCTPWLGRISQPGEDEDLSDADDDDATTELAGMTIGGTANCAAEDTECLAEGEESDNGGSADRRAAGKGGSVSVTGMIQAVDAKGLVLRMDVGRYVSFELPAAPALSRRTDFSLQEAVFQAGDRIGVVQGRGLDEIRVYRNAAWPDTGADASKAWPEGGGDGMERRGVLQNVERSGNGALLQVATGQTMRTHQADAEHTVVAIIEAASFSEIKPFSGVARVSAERLEDGTLLVRSIEILR